MSVVGIDLGCDFSKVAVAHKKKIQVVPNELTKLQTPTLTAFTDKERFFGDGAKTQWTRNYKNTVPQLKRWLGLKYDDPKLQKEANFWLQCDTGKLPDGRFGIKCKTSQGELVLAPEQILSGFLTQLKKFTKIFLNGLKVTDCVIACPSYFDDAQRRALLTAAKLAELKVLRLLEEPTAIALNYGILRNLPENEARRVIFVDIGYATTQVAIVDFVKGKLTVRYKSCNTNVGGRDFDRCLYEIFRKRWLAKYKVDIETVPKAKLKLLRAANAIKKILTGNQDAEWCLDCFHDDHDFNIKINRAEFEEAAKEAKLYEAVSLPIHEAFEATKNDHEEKNNSIIPIHSCEIVGGSSRVPSIQASILKTIQQHESHITNISTTLNGDETVARGCALMCAMLSPNFRVREFQVHDIISWPITISYPSDKEENKTIDQLIMKRGAPQPCTAKVTFNKTKNFVFKLQHPTEYKTNDSVVNISYPFQTSLDIGEFNVQLLPLNNKAIQDPKIKIFLDINKQGLLDWPKATLIEWIKREPKPEPVPEPKKDDKKKNKKNNKKDKKKDKKDNKKDKKDDKDRTDESAKDDTNKDKDKQDEDNDTEMNNKEKDTKKEEDDKDKTEDQPKSDKDDDNDENMEDKTDKADKADKTDDKDKDKDDESQKTDEKEQKKKKEKKKICRDLIITGSFFNSLVQSEYNKYYELEANLLNVDRIIHETYEAKNDLETYVYSLRDKIDASHRDFVKESDRAPLTKKLTDLEDWVYDEGDDANKTEFLERLKSLKDIGNPMEFRKWEFEHRTQRIEQFKKLIFQYQRFIDNKDEKYDHIEQDKREEIKKFADEMDKWMTDALIKQDKLKQYENPSIKCKDIDDKYRELYNKAQPIVNTPKPPPPKKEEPEAKKEDGKDKDDKDNKDDKDKDKKDDPEKQDDDNDTQMADKTDKTETETAKDTNNDDNNDKDKDKTNDVDGMEVE